MAQIKRKFSNCPMTKEEEEEKAAQVFVLEMKICTGGRGGHVEDDIEELER